MQPKESARRIERLMHRDGNRCWLCGEFLDFSLRHGRYPFITVDHVKPKSDGGPNGMHNLRLAHKKCNNDRGSKPAEPHPSWKNEAGMNDNARAAHSKLIDAGFSHAQAMSALKALGFVGG